MQATETPTLWSDQEEIGEALAAAPTLALTLDFDGTLAPIVTDPEDATMPSTIREPLERLTQQSRTTVAVVSGRQLDDLQERVGIDDVAYAGNHGLELAVGDERTVPEQAGEWRDAIDETVSALEARLADVDGCTIEHKGLTATVHVRRVPDDQRVAVQEILHDTVPEIDDRLEITPGKAIWELRPPIDWDKGRAMAAILERAHEDVFAAYVGDDVTDEDAFEALAESDGDTLSVLVGNRPDTAAEYRLIAQEAVADFLRFVERNR